MVSISRAFLRRFDTDDFRSLRELGRDMPRYFQGIRGEPRYQEAYAKADPLVSVCIATYNRGELLIERSLRSLLNQTYGNLEIIVVGDACTDDTEERMAAVRDSRVRFINLPRRGDYPSDPSHRWMVAGTAPANHALSLAAGDFITHLDDDDEHAPDRVEKLVAHMRKTQADLIYHPFRYEVEPDVWRVNDAAALKRKSVTTSSIFYHGWFRTLGWDPFAYRHPEPGDWNRLRKIQYLGARTVRHPDVLLSHYRERSQRTG